MSELAANIEEVQRRITAAAQRSGRQSKEITLVAVTKTYPLETVIGAYQAGLRHFGENRTQEGRDKVTRMRQWLADDSTCEVPVWHFIGHLQTRQVGDMLGYFDLTHAVDSLKLAQRISRLAKRDDYPPVHVLLQCNVSGEDAKSGFNLVDWANQAPQFTEFMSVIEQIAALDKISIQGLMTMAPFVDDPEETRPVFKSLAALRERLAHELPEIDWLHLSMGMTNDFEVAIEEGATIVRVGRALFGERD